MTATALWLRPSTPTAEQRAAYAAAARAMLDAEARPELAYVELTTDDEIAIRPLSLVRVLSSSADCPLYVRVLRVYSDDTLFVEAPKWTRRLHVDEVGIVLCREAAEVEAG